MKRLLAGELAPAMECMLLAYSKGKPKESVVGDGVVRRAVARGRGRPNKGRALIAAGSLTMSIVDADAVAEEYSTNRESVARILME